MNAFLQPDVSLSLVDGDLLQYIDSKNQVVGSECDPINPFIDPHSVQYIAINGRPQICMALPFSFKAVTNDQIVEINHCDASALKS